MLDNHEECTPASTGRESESGYVAAMTALLLIPLMIMAAFAVDVGSWYSVGAKTQTAADAAALSAVAQLPNLDGAVRAAFAEAARNGYVDADGHSQASFDNATSYPQILVSMTSEAEVQVIIKTQAEATFGKVVLPDGIEVTRLSRAQFIRPVPMGNPTSQLGGGQLSSPQDIANAFWLSTQAYCAKRQDGARGFVGFESNANGCPNSVGPVAQAAYFDFYSYNAGGVFGWTTNNPWPFTFNLDTSGRNPNDWATPYPGEPLKNEYFVAIELSPAVALNSYRVQIYRPGTCIGHIEAYDFNELMRAGTWNGRPTVTGPRIRTRLYNVDTTLVDRWDAVTQANIRDERLWNLTDCSGDGNDGTGWYTIDTIGGSAGEAGTHYLSYGTDNVANEVWSNVFALRVVPQNSTAICTDVAMTGACPTITAVDSLPIYIDSLNEDTTALFGGGQTVEFYLANVAEEHAGKTLEIKLYDAGEGMDYLQILRPGGNVVDFHWKSTACVDTGFCSAGDRAGGLASTMGNCVRPCLDVKKTVFNNNEATLSIDIPSNYSCGSDCWWKVRYVPQASGVTDATEWSVNVKGDPVRLTD